MGKVLDLTGQRFTRLLAISRTDISTSNGLLWNCLCDCGNSVRVAAKPYTPGTKSCGCLIRDTAAKLNKTHGLWTNNKKGLHSVDEF